MSSKLDLFLQKVKDAITNEDGDVLGSLLSINDSTKAIKFPPTIKKVVVVISNLDEDFKTIATLQNAVAINLHAIVTSMTRWCLPVIFTVNRELYDSSWRAELKGANVMEEHTRTMNKAFSICATDRFSSPQESRKWGVYYIVNLLFKTYFKISSINLCANILKSIGAADLPPLEQYPKSDQATFKYYTGILAFYDEKYSQSSLDLTYSLQLTFSCPKLKDANITRILQYLIPIQILLGSFPKFDIPDQLEIYIPIIKAIKSGNLKEFDLLLKKSLKKLVDLNVFLIVERCRLLVVRQLFRKIWLFLDKSNRLTVDALSHGISVALERTVEDDEVYCFIVNLIDMGLMKGYVSFEKKTIVLSNKDPFPLPVKID
ncbi:COP9 signalosome (CSN) subunit [Terramyces sp. JEL0728]|nr:COP9 signalosome (CSN) subunit [Terramyces sp. JEL0728]